MKQDSLLKPPEQKKKGLTLSPSVMLKKLIINEVKLIIAGRKVLKALRSNVHLKEAIIDRYYQLILAAERKLKPFLIGSYYRIMYKKKIFIATLYLETREQLRPS